MTPLSSSLLLPAVGLLLLLLMCGGRISALSFPDCSTGPLSRLAVCDPSQPLLTRASSLVAAMNLSEKASRLQNGAPEVARLGLPAYQW